MKSVPYADVAELADAPDLGSGVPDVQVQVLSSARCPGMGGLKIMRLFGVWSFFRFVNSI